MSEDALVTAIEESIAAQLMVEVSAEAYAFSHALTRQAIYAGLLTRERRALHARLAHAIEHTAAGQPDATLDDLAYHFFEAGDWERAAVLGRAAGDRARALDAPHAAAGHYTRALEVSAHFDAGPDAELLHARGQMFDAIGDFDAARADYETALAAAESASDAATALSSLLGLGRLWSGRDYDQALVWLTRAIGLARTMNDPTALARALNRLGNWHANHEEIDEALRCHDEALAIFDGLGDRRGLAATLDLLAMAHSLGSGLAKSRQAALQAAALFEELGDRQGLAGVLILTTTPGAVFELETMVGGSNVTSAVGVGERALALVREIDWRSGEAFILALLGEVWAAGGDFGKAWALVHESIAIAEEIDHRQWMVQARWGLARLFGVMLAQTREREELERVLALSREIHSPIWIGSAAAGLASTLVRLGETEGAEALLAATLTADTPLQAQGQRLLWAARADLALASGQPREALAIVDRLYATAVNLTDEGEIPRLAHLKANALAALHEPGKAETLLRAAQASSRVQGALPTLRTLHAELAELLRRQGRMDDGLVEERAAREIAGRLAATIPEGEMREGFRRAAGLAADDATAAPRPPSDAAAGGLTPREREVAAYLTAGRSNRQIAEELFVSERTVEAHVANILRKLGVPSRAGIAAWAARRDGADPGT